MLGSFDFPFLSGALMVLITSCGLVASFQSRSIQRRMYIINSESKSIGNWDLARDVTGCVAMSRKRGHVTMQADFNSDDFITDEDLFASLEQDDNFSNQFNYQASGEEDLFNSSYRYKEFGGRAGGEKILGRENSVREGESIDPFTRPSGRPSVPVLGPFLMQPPLLVADQYVMKDPTPMQWKTLEEAFYLHEALGRDSVVHAAPIVALMDEVTADLSVAVPGEKRKKGRYATLAAVVGMSMDGLRDDCDMFGDDGMRQEGCTVRLIGIGRAVITDCYNRLPSSDDEYLDDDDYDSQGFSSSDYLAKSTPIVMGEFVFLSDGSHSSSVSKGGSNPGMTVKLPSESNTNFQMSMQRAKFLDGAGIGSTGSSPVAAITKLSQISNQLGWMHQSRQILVNQIKTAHVRLQQYHESDGFEFDGYGDLMGFLFSDEDLFQKTIMQNGESLLFLDNYGLNYFGALTPLMSMACEARDQLYPFYSVEHQEREEWEYEIQSYVAWKVLSDIVSPRDLAWSLLCTSTIERLQKAYDIMSDHRIALQIIADRLRDVLWDFNDDASDIF